VAIEPALENMLLLRLSVLANGLDGVVRTVQSAVSNEIGVAGLDVAGIGSEYHRLDPASGDGELRQLVPTTTLDALAADGTLDLGRVSLLWMDIEGYEIHALEGASSIVERGIPFVTEACSDKLERTGTLDRIDELLAPHYTHILDLRRDRETASFRPITEIGDVIREYEGHCVDVLVCRLPPGANASS
jgi:FkbM family methyltransferase